MTNRTPKRVSGAPAFVKVGAATLAMGAVTYGALELGVHWLVASLLVAPPIYVAASLAVGAFSREDLRMLAGGPAPAEEPNQPIEPAEGVPVHP